MEIAGIRFAPLNIPLKRRLQTLAAGCWFLTFAFGGFVGVIILVTLIFTPLMWLMVMYLLWIFVFDKDTCEKGGRRSEWVRSWIWWEYYKDYFPINLERAPWVELNPNKNYLFCCFPHGMLCSGAFASFGTNHSGFKDFFPHHTPYIMTLAQHFKMPFFRELALALGGMSASAESIKWVLSSPGTGRVACLVPGGAAESYYCRPGQYKLVLKSRKGFVKLAIRTGSPLVPVFSFGETDLFDQPNYDQHAKLHAVQEFLRKYIGIAPAIPLGRGLLQYSFGLVPHRRPITTVVGKPLEVEKIEDPTKEQVEQVHEQFLQHLANFFEEQKHRYIKNSENTFLEIT